MPVTPPCPGVEDLKRFRLGSLPEAQARGVEQHLLGCAACLGRLPGLGLDDPLLKGLRALGNRPRLNNPLLAQVVQAVRSQPFRPAANQAGQSPAPRSPRSRRWLMGGGGIAVVGLVLVVALVAGRKPKPDVVKKEPEGGARDGSGERRAYERVRFEGPADSTAEVKSDRSFSETWVTRPAPVEGLKGWCIETNDMGQRYPIAFDFLEDGRLLIRFVSIQPGVLPAWELFDPKTCGLSAAPFGGSWTAVARDGRACARATAGGVELWEESGTRAWTTLRSPGAAHAAAFSPDGKKIVTLSGGMAYELRFWDSREGSKLGTCELSGRWVNPAVLDWSADGKTLAAGGANAVLLFRSSWKSPFKTLNRPRGVNALRWSPAGKYLATVEADGRIHVLDPETGKDALKLPKVKVAGTPAWAPDGKELAFGTQDRKVIVWDVEKKKVTFTLTGHVRSIHAVAFLPDGRTLVSAGGGSVRFWDLQKNRLRGSLLSLGGPGWVAISPEGYFRCSEGGESRFVIKVREQNLRNQEITRLREFSPDEFRKVYGWKNKPERVKLSGK
jgi:WD40 repeat protein